MKNTKIKISPLMKEVFDNVNKIIPMLDKVEGPSLQHGIGLTYHLINIVQQDLSEDEIKGYMLDIMNKFFDLEFSKELLIGNEPNCDLTAADDDLIDFIKDGSKIDPKQIITDLEILKNL